MAARRRSEEERRDAIVRAAFEVAARRQLGGLTVREVAEAAGVSKGLVFFYFGDRDTLLLSLLDWLLETTLVLDPLPGGSEERPGPRLLALVTREVRKLPEERAQAEMFLDFWVQGRSAPEIQERIRRAFARYREAFLPFTEAVVAQAPERFGPEGARGLASAVVSFIEGCALQLIADPDRFDVDRYMRAVRGLVLR